MKNLSRLPLLLFFVFFLPTLVKAQTDERNKIQMVINNQGKTITAELSAVSLGITRYNDAYETAETAAMPKEKSTLQGNYYLALSVKKVSPELLKLFAKKQTRFNGTITITDTYGKNPAREIKFTNAALDSYSDQFSTMSYDDAYSVASISLSVKGLTVNGVEIE